MSSKGLKLQEGMLVDMSTQIDMPEGVSRPASQREQAGVAGKPMLRAVGDGLVVLPETATGKAPAQAAIIPMPSLDVNIERLAQQSARDGIRSGVTSVVSEGLPAEKDGEYNIDKRSRMGKITAITKETSSSLGLTDMATGTVGFGRNLAEGVGASAHAFFGLAWDIGQALAGRKSFSEVGESLLRRGMDALHHFKEMAIGAWHMVKGVGLLLGELTGVTDVVMCLVCLSRGDWGMAAMHFGFALASWGTIAAVVATGGIAAPAVYAAIAGKMSAKAALKEVAQVASKEFLKGTGKEIGKKVLAEVGQELEKGMATAAREAASESIEQLGKLGAENISKEALETLSKQPMDTAVQGLLRGAKVDKVVDRLCGELLEGIESKSVKALSAELGEKGIKDPKLARAMAKELKAMLESGKSREVMKQALEDGISEPIIKHLEEGMVKAYKDQLRKGLLGELGTESSEIVGKALREQAEKLGKNLDDLVDEYVEAGWKGAREGIESGTRKVVREGIEKAFKRLLRDYLGSDSSTRPEEKKRLAEATLIPVTPEEMRREAQAVAKREADLQVWNKKLGERVVETRHFRVDGKDVAEEWEYRDGKWLKLAERVDQEAVAATEAAKKVA